MKLHCSHISADWLACVRSVFEQDKRDFCCILREIPNKNTNLNNANQKNIRIWSIMFAKVLNAHSSTKERYSNTTRAIRWNLLIGFSYNLWFYFILVFFVLLTCYLLNLLIFWNWHFFYLSSIVSLLHLRKWFQRVFCPFYLFGTHLKLTLFRMFEPCLWIWMK